MLGLLMICCVDGLLDSGASFNVDFPRNNFKTSTNWSSRIVQGFNSCNLGTVFKVFLSLFSSSLLPSNNYLSTSSPFLHGHFSHGLRTGIFEATKLVLINVAPTLPDIQVMLIIMLLGLLIFHLQVLNHLNLGLPKSLEWCLIAKSSNWQ
jgi:hypothetical protein